jgi:thiamine biosynthesis lipoprotein
VTPRLPAVVALWIGASFLAAPHLQVPLHRHEATRLSMGSVYAIEAYGPDATALPRIVETAFDEVDRIDALMSHYKASSELSRINRDAAEHPVVVDPELFTFLEEAMRYYRSSGGTFDITVGPLMKAWGFFRGEGRMPSTRELAAARRTVGGDHVALNHAAGTVRFDRAGVELDLGGIAKGYAVDRAVRLLRDRGIPAALVSAGGSTIYGLGAPPGRRAWAVTIQDPRDARKTALTVPLADRAVSVSGSSEKWFEVDGVRYSHIMDPRTGSPVQGVLSVVVVTDTGTSGDALDNAFYVLGPGASQTYLNQFAGTEVFFFLADPKRPWRLIHERAGHDGAARKH